MKKMLLAIIATSLLPIPVAQAMFKRNKEQQKPAPVEFVASASVFDATSGKLAELSDEQKALAKTMTSTTKDVKAGSAISGTSHTASVGTTEGQRKELQEAQRKIDNPELVQWNGWCVYPEWAYQLADSKTPNEQGKYGCQSIGTEVATFWIKKERTRTLPNAMDTEKINVARIPDEKIKLGETIVTKALEIAKRAGKNVSERAQLTAKDIKQALTDLVAEGKVPVKLSPYIQMIQ